MKAFQLEASEIDSNLEGDLTRADSKIMEKAKDLLQLKISEMEKILSYLNEKYELMNKQTYYEYGITDFFNRK